MKKWPKELNDVLPDGEQIEEDGKIKFTWNCRLTLAQRKVLRAFLFDLKKNERFVYFHPELNKEFVVNLDGDMQIEVDWDWDWDEDDSKEKTYWLDMTVAGKKKTR